MKRAALIVAVAILLGATPAAARGHGRYGGHGGHGGHRGWHHSSGFRSQVFIGSGFFWDPFFYPRYYPYPVPYSYPYPYAYPYPVYTYPGPPPDWEPAAGDDYEDTVSADVAEDPMRTTYGLVQLQGVPDGAEVELDGRPWIKATRLDERWLALPQGTHTIVVRARDAESVERRIEVAAGRTQVVRLPPPRRDR